MFEEYKTYRYIFPGYLLVVYTAMMVFPFLTKVFVIAYGKETLTLVVGSRGNWLRSVVCVLVLMRKG